MRSVLLRVYGTSLRLATDEEPALEAFSRDFAYFRAPDDPGPADVSLTLHARAPSPAELPSGKPSVSAGPWSAADAGPLRTVRYRGGETVVYDYEREEGRVYCEEPDRLHELAYLLALSRLGARLDARGLHRAHALGFEWRGSGGLLLLPSGGGKSTLALELLARTPAGIVSEDTPVLDARGRLRAFPLRMGFRPDADLSAVPPALVRPFARRYHGPKRLVDLEFFRDRVRDDVPLRWVIVGRAGGARPAVRAASASEALGALGLNLVVGWGVPQLAEYALRVQHVPALARAALSRARTAVAAARTAATLSFELGPRPADAAAALVEALSK